MPPKDLLFPPQIIIFWQLFYPKTPNLPELEKVSIIFWIIQLCLPFGVIMWAVNFSMKIFIVMLTVIEILNKILRQAKKWKSLFFFNFGIFSQENSQKVVNCDRNACFTWISGILKGKNLLCFENTSKISFQNSRTTHLFTVYISLFSFKRGKPQPWTRSMKIKFRLFFKEPEKGKFLIK